jgi:hypothetical protein
MAVTVHSVTSVCSIAGNGGGRITYFDARISFENGDTEATQAAILALVPGSGSMLGICDYGGAQFEENGGGTDGCGPYYDSDNAAIRFVNLVDGVKNTAISASANAHFTVLVSQ